MCCENDICVTYITTYFNIKELKFHSKEHVCSTKRIQAPPWLRCRSVQTQSALKVPFLEISVLCNAMKQHLVFTEDVVSNELEMKNNVWSFFKNI